MVWRLYDTINGQWYNDVLYPTQEACGEAANYHMREAHAVGEVLELVTEPLDPSEPLESVLEDIQEP
jgi:hypothetical protein